MVVMHTRLQSRFITNNGVQQTIQKTYHGMMTVHSLKKILQQFLPDYHRSLNLANGPVAKMGKKKEILKWLEDRITETASGNQDPDNGLLLRLLKLMTEKDGKLWQK
jgi:hypothetical protein